MTPLSITITHTLRTTLCKRHFVRRLKHFESGVSGTTKFIYNRYFVSSYTVHTNHTTINHISYQHLSNLINTFNTMFPSVTRTLQFLARTPLVPQSSGPAAIELSSFAAGPSRPRAASRTFSSMSVKSAYGYSIQQRGYASAPGKKELYSDEGGATGAGVSPLPSDKNDY